MTAIDHPIIRNVATGVPGLDTVLGGGLCEYSFNLVAGAPGSGMRGVYGLRSTP